MFEIEINGKQVKAEVSFYTAVIYEQEFMSDMLQDFFGVQKADSPIDVDGDSIIKIDFTKINWASAMKVLWAAVKTANDSTAAYSTWMKKAKGANMWLIREQLADEISDCFFRAEPAGEKIS